MAAVALMTALSAQAQKIEVVGADGHGIPLVSVLTEDGNLIGTTDHYYMDKEEWKAKKKSMKEDYSNKMTLDQLDSYATSHKIPALSPAARQAVGKLKQW